MNLLYKNPLRTIVIFGALLRIIILVFYQHISTFPDSDGYRELSTLLTNLNLSGYFGYRSPGYPLLLSLANGNFYIVIFLQFLIGVASMVVLYKNMLLLKFSSKNALFATLVMNSFLHVAFYETCILTESLTLFFMTFVFNVMLNNYFNNKSIKTDLLMAFLLAYLVFIKPFYIFLPILIYGFFILKNFNAGIFRSSKIIILFFPIMIFLGWSYVNKINTGYFVPTTFYGYNLSQNCVYFAEKTSPKYEEISKIYVRHREEKISQGKDVSMSIWDAYNDIQEATGLSFVDLSFELSQYSKELIKNNPADYLKQVTVSWYDFWRTDIYWNETQFKVKKSAPAFIWVWDIQHYLLRFFKIAFLFNILLLLFSFMKNRTFSSEIIITTIIIVTSLLQAFSTYGTNSRFSYPFESLMIVVVLLQFKKLWLDFRTKKIF
ncbi:hypothetical protein [Flavobacterium sp.]|uniref:hypothetical protein n=1 Tax=Flavobacterium sp. TaxID=239 RepID=UPI0024881539|nr:hypothetical protein [Flavobacterium sp.]MDI1316708.1 hypothetical protein [Flavobacterium sp.]